MNWDTRLETFEDSDIGMRRANNQDARKVLLAPDMETWRKRGHFFMVADGMGAHAAGELASGLAVEGVAHLYHKYTDLSPPEALQKAILETNAKVHRKGQENIDFRNMGTTASVLLLLPQGVIIAHIGDSRIYRLRQGCIEQLTFDHSLVWELRRAGQFSEDMELSHAIPKNVITRSLGPNSTVQADVEGPLPVQVGDTFLLCSDGLTGRIEDDELAAILSHLPLREAGQMLLDLANLRGGPDNITVVLFKVKDEELATPNDNSSPITIGSTRPKAVNPALWACFAVCVLMALVLLLTHNGILAVVAFVGAIVSLLIGLVSRARSHTPGVMLGEGYRLGKAPYARATCPSTRETAERWSAAANDLRRNSVASSSPLDWAEFDKWIQEGREAITDNQFGAAISAFARAFRRLMQSIKDSQNGLGSDSNIDL